MNSWVLTLVTIPQAGFDTFVNYFLFETVLTWFSRHHSLVSSYFSSYFFPVSWMIICSFIFPTSKHQDTQGSLSSSCVTSSSLMVLNIQSYLWLGLLLWTLYLHFQLTISIGILTWNAPNSSFSFYLFFFVMFLILAIGNPFFHVA